jgi:hypothetical protein
VQERLPVPPSERLTNLFLDALTYHPRAMAATADLVGTGRMAFGTDHPFSVSDPAGGLAGLEEAFDGEALEAVQNRSAVEYFGLPDLDHPTPDGRQ